MNMLVDGETVERKWRSGEEENEEIALEEGIS